MRLIIILFLFFGILSCSSRNQENGKTFSNWEGSIKADEIELNLVFKINKGECLLDVPAQGIQNFPSSKYEVIEDSIYIEFSGIIRAKFVGENQKDTLIIGKWMQMDKSFPMILKRKREYVRPQTPQPPFPYSSENVAYFNCDKSIKFGGTLTIPKEGTKHPVAIVISGSGQQDRDQTIFGHKTFLVIADYLTRHGISVLRVDDRGIGQTTGTETLVSATSYDFALDVIAAIEYLKSRGNINPNQIGLIGHSEGGLIASIVGAKRNDIAFIISLAGVGVNGDRLILSQIEKSLQRTIKSPSLDSIMIFEKRFIDIINQESNNRLALVTILQTLTSKRLDSQDSIVKKYFGMEIKDGSEVYNIEATGDRYKQLMLPWYRYFLMYDPADYLPKINAPFLALNGDKDTQVLADLNLNGFIDMFDRCGKKNYKTISYPDLNHFFQPSKTGYYEEVESIEETISPEVLNDISTWIKEQVEKY